VARGVAVFTVVLTLAATAGSTASATARVGSAFVLVGGTTGSAVGQSVQAVEDDGTIPDGTNGLQASMVRVLTTSGVTVRIVLSSFKSTSDARRYFSSYAQSGQPVAGLSGQSSVDGNGRVTVQKGAQLLQIEARPSADLENQLDQIKLNGGDPRTSPAYAALTETGPSIARSLASRMRGSAVSKPSLQLPKGAVNPCVLGAKAAKKALGSNTPVTSGYSLSEEPPGMQCVYTGSGGPIGLIVTTNPQLQSAITTSDVETLYDANLTSSRGQGATELTGVGTKAFSTPSSERVEAVVGQGKKATLVVAVGEISLSYRREVLQDFIKAWIAAFSKASPPGGVAR